jgi:DUF1365 family protein
MPGSRPPRSAVPTTCAIRAFPWPTPFGTWLKIERAGSQSDRSLLTLLRNWGHYFCPLSLYYCFDGSGQTVDAVVAEVMNTPWHERHWYVLHKGNRIGDPSQLRSRHPKGFHVSPFMDMDMVYQWHLHEPGPELSVAIANSRGDQRLFDVSLALKRRELSRWSMLSALARHPWMTGRVVQAIYWQAFRLWWKKCPFYAHPECGEGSEAR